MDNIKICLDSFNYGVIQMILEEIFKLLIMFFLVIMLIEDRILFKLFDY